MSSISVSKFPVKSLIEMSKLSASPLVNKFNENFKNFKQNLLWRKDAENEAETKFNISQATQNDLKRIKGYMERNFLCEEPLAKNLKMCYGKIDEPLELYIGDILSHGTSLIATGDNNKLIGLCLGRRSCQWHSQNLDELANISRDIRTQKLVKIWAVLGRQSRRALHNNGLADKDIFDLGIVWAKRNDVLSNLTGMAVSLAQDLNYSVAKIDCTNIHLQKILEQDLNATKIVDIPYRSFMVDYKGARKALFEFSNSIQNNNAKSYYLNLKNDTHNNHSSRDSDDDEQ